MFFFCLLRGFKTICNTGSRKMAKGLFVAFLWLDQEKFLSHCIGHRENTYIPYSFSYVSSGYLIKRQTCHIVSMKQTDVHYGYSHHSMDDYMGKSLVTLGASKWLISCMDTLVRLQVDGLREALVTLEEFCIKLRPFLLYW